MGARQHGKVEINADDVVASLEGVSIRGRKVQVVHVGFSAPYAVYVHENLQARHANGEAKFLENAAKKVGGKMRVAVQTALNQKKALASGLDKAGNILLDEARRRVPVLTGFLRDSGFVVVQLE